MDSSEIYHSFIIQDRNRIKRFKKKSLFTEHTSVLHFNDLACGLDSSMQLSEYPANPSSAGLMPDPNKIQ